VYVLYSNVPVEGEFDRTSAKTGRTCVLNGDYKAAAGRASSISILSDKSSNATMTR